VTDEIHDTSRLDSFMAARRRAMVLHAVWRLMAAGAVGAALVIGAVWVTLPKFTVRQVEIPKVSYREVEVPRITTRDVTVNNLVPHDLPVEIPRVVAAPTPMARTPAEERFVETEGWKGAVIRGRILRPDKNGFVLLTDEGEQGFYPATLDAAGKIEPNPSVEDRVENVINDLGYCRKQPIGTFNCTALHDGREVEIQQEPIKPGRPT
jgi:hypothetical protein